jgi:hypothetical protein
MTPQRLTVLFLAGVALVNAPLVGLAAASGPVALVGYLFVAWAALVGGAAWVVRRGR